MKFHPDGSQPQNGEIFVFGSNQAGVHGAGAALAAAMKFGAARGIGEGLVGQSYALPTKDFSIQTMSLPEIEVSVAMFLNHARIMADKNFFVTAVGCGLAGYTHADIAPMFKRAPDNCSFPEEWREYLEVPK